MSTLSALVVFTHGVGGRGDPPVAPWLATYAGAAVVAFSFFALASLWARPRLRGQDAGQPVPRVQRLVDTRVSRVLLRTVGVLLLGVFLTVAWLGPDDLGRANPAPTWFYAWFWVGLVPASLLCGPVWKLLNPLRTASGLLCRVLRSEPLRLPAWVAYWPATAGLLAFLWLELVYDQAASPQAVAQFVTVYCAVHTLAGAVFGPAWFSRADAFEVYSSLVGRAAPIGRRRDGRLVLRNPLDGLAGTPTDPDLTPVIVVVLGSTAFDGLSRVSWWSGLVAGTGRAEYLLLGTAGLLVTTGFVLLTFATAMRLTRRHLSLDEDPRPDFAPTLIPIAIGYTIAHYFSFALFQGQQGLLLATDPLALGWDLFGLSGSTVNYTLLSSIQISIVQITAIVVGHVLAVVAAHDLAVRRLRPRLAVRGQYPLMAVMVAYTAGGIALLAGS